MNIKSGNSAGRKRNEAARELLKTIFLANPDAKIAEAAKSAGCGAGLAYEVKRQIDEQGKAQAA